jgi:NAD(P)H-flavin reductase
LFVAGGVGLVPLRPSVVEAIARAGEFETIAVVVGARTPADLLFVDTLDAWGSAGVQVITTVDRGDRAWHGHIGVVTEVLDLVECAPARTSALVCGPEVMMRFTAQALEGMGVPLSDVQLSLERNMKCAVGHCGHCQIGGSFVCLDGPVVTADRATPLLRVRER